MVAPAIYRFLFAWFTARRWRLSLFHCLLALPVLALGWLIVGPVGALWGVAVGFYFREVCQHQYSLKGGGSTSTVWTRGWWPPEWPRASQFDFYAPLLSSAGVVLAAQLL